MQRPVALKVIAPRLLEQPGAVERFEQEVKAAAKLQHPNIVTAHDAEQVGPVTVLVMEYVEGRSLADVLQDRGRLPVAEACDYARQAALGLAHAHRLGMIHRDVKPHNLMLTPDGRVKILDFGLARLIADAAPEAVAPAAGSVDDDISLTRSGACMGTLDYMAPEQARDARLADARADVYSLGATFNLLSGTVLFPGGTAAQKLSRLSNENTPSAATLRPELAPGLCRVMDRMLAKDPGDRFATASEVATALEPFCAPPTPPRRYRRYAVLAAAAFAFVAVLAAAVVKFQTEQGEVVIETDDSDIEVVIKGDKVVRIVDPRTKRAYVLDRQDLTFGSDDADGLQVTLDGGRPITLKRQGRQIAVIRLLPPGGQAGPVLAHSPRTQTPRVPTLSLLRRHPLPTDKDFTHGGHFYVGAFSQDGAQYAAGGDGNAVHVWDAKTGAMKQTLRHAGWNMGIAFTADGTRLITTGRDNTLRLWNLATGALLHSQPVEGPGLVFVSPNGKQFVFSRADGTVRVWDIEGWTERLSVRPGLPCTGLFSPDGKELVTWAGGKLLQRWDANTGQLLAAVETVPNAAIGAAFVAGGRLLLVGREGISWRDPYTLKELGGAKAPDGGRIDDWAVSPDGWFLAFGDERRPEARLWDLVTGIESPRLPLTAGPRKEFAFDPSGRVFVAGGFRGAVNVLQIDVPVDPAPARAFTGHTSFIKGMAVTTDGSKIYSTGSDETVRVWDVPTGREIRQLARNSRPLDAVALPSDGRFVFVPHRDLAVRMWDTSTGKELGACVGHTHQPCCVALSADGKVGVTGALDNTVRVWDLPAGTERYCLRGHTQTVRSVAVSPDGSLGASTRHDGTVRVWVMATGREVWANRDGTQWNFAVAFSPDCKSVLTGNGPTNEVVLLDSADGTVKRRFAGFVDRIHSVAFNAAGTRVAAGGFDGAVRVWDAASGELLHTFPGHDKIVSWVAFLPDGRLVSASFDRTIRIWDIPTGPQ